MNSLKRRSLSMVLAMVTSAAGMGPILAAAPVLAQPAEARDPSQGASQGQERQGRGEQHERGVDRRNPDRLRDSQRRARGDNPRDWSDTRERRDENRNQRGGPRNDDHILQGLPRYQGQEWRHAEADVVLVQTASDIGYEILLDVPR
ncbi:hypothetical protein [Billgrantia endophytica]|uniref:hypothetical protein n=1 Tax=Billgrantia endophytica TaxID=2033802 RepID=UPI0010569804|nr:hypothetical protein [Halomonas endophytica]